MSIFIIFIIFCIGLAVGSFLNVAIVRLPEGRTVRGRSACLACSRTLTWTELIPLVSFFILRGKCKSCRTPISWQYPIVELITGVLFIATWYFHNYSITQLPVLLRDAFFLSVLLVIFVHDLRWSIIIDRVTLPALAVTLALQFWIAPTFATVQSLAIGMTIGGGFFAAQYIVSRGRWIGGGDIRLGVLMGAMLGWRGTLVSLFLAYMIGAVIASILLLVRRKRFGDAIPFGTFLTVATAVSLFYGEAIIQWYAHAFIF
ncbi:prepilin peptidase [Candidatus Uhrbacteria bacterium]|nr:prepilin peptidase [Candidatus Uhrbacteria bacterium]